MNLTELEQHVLAYFLATDALSGGIDERFYKRHEFVKIFEDRIFHATPDFGGVVQGRPTNVATYLVDELIKQGALSTVNDEYSGESHKFNRSKYKEFIKQLIESNTLCERARQAGPQFWPEAFAALK